MFSKLLKSAARKSLLEIFLNDSRQKYYLRELAVMIQYSPGSLQRELNSLVEDELLLAEKMGNLRFFSLNTKSHYVKELRQYLLAHPQDKARPALKQPAVPKEPANNKASRALEAPRASRAPQPPPTPEVPKPQSKPVLERRPPPPKAEPAPGPAPVPAPVVAPVAPPSPTPAPAPASAPSPVPAPIIPPPTFTPTQAPIQSADGYTRPISPFSKPILTKPHLEKPDFGQPESKPNQHFDYPAIQAPEAFQYIAPHSEEPEAPQHLSYTPVYASEASVSPTPVPASPSMPTPIYPTTQPTIHQKPPDEPGDDIRLHIS